MQIEHRVVQHSSKRPPLWANDDAKLRAAVVAYMSARAQLRTPDCGKSDAQRLARAEGALRERRAKDEAKLTELCYRHVEAKRSGDLKAARNLEVQIQNLDTVLMHNNRMAAIATKCAILWWREGWDCVSIAGLADINLSPVCVRQILHRLRQCGDAQPAEAGDLDRARYSEYKRAWSARQREDPKFRAAEAARVRHYRAMYPEYRERQAAKLRAIRAQKKADAQHLES